MLCIYVSNPLLKPKGPLHREVVQSIQDSWYGSATDPNSTFSKISSSYKSGDHSILLRLLRNESYQDITRVFRFANQNRINPQAIKLFRQMMQDPNQEVKAAARKMFFSYIKHNELNHIASRLDPQNAHKLFNLLEQYFISNDESERDDLSFQIANKAGCAYTGKGEDGRVMVDESGAGSDAQYAQMPDFVRMFKRSSAGQLIFDMIHDSKEGFLQRNENYVLEQVLATGDTEASPALSKFIATQFLRVNRITPGNVALAFEGVFHAVEPGSALAPQLVNSEGFNSDAEKEAELQFLRDSGLNPHEAENFKFDFAELAKKLFSSDKHIKERAVRDFALAHALLNFRKARIEASTVSTQSRFSILGYELLASDKTKAIEYADRQINLLEKFLNQRFLEDARVQKVFSDLVTQEHKIYLTQVGLSQLATENGLYAAQIRQINDRYSEANMGRGAPKMPPVSLKSLVTESELLEPFEQDGSIFAMQKAIDFALKLQERLYERYGEPKVGVNQLIDENFELMTQSSWSDGTVVPAFYILKADSSVNLGRAPRTRSEWTNYTNIIEQENRNLLIAFRDSVVSTTRAGFVDRLKLEEELKNVFRDLKSFINSPGVKDTQAGSAFLQASDESTKNPYQYNCTQKLRELIRANPFLSSHADKIFDCGIDEIEMPKCFDSQKPDDYYRACCNRLQERILKPGYFGSELQQGLESDSLTQLLDRIKNYPRAELNEVEQLIQDLVNKHKSDSKNKTADDSYVLENLLYNTDTQLGPEKRLLGLVQLLGLAKTEATGGDQKYIQLKTYLLSQGVDLTSMDDPALLIGNDYADSFQKFNSRISSNGLDSIGEFGKFGYYDTMLTTLNREIADIDFAADSTRKSRLSNLISPLMRLMGKEGEHMQVLEGLYKAVEDCRDNASVMSFDSSYDERLENFIKLRDNLHLPKMSFNDDGQWLKNLSADSDRLDILTMIFDLCKKLFSEFTSSDDQVVKSKKAPPAKSTTSYTTPA